MHTMIPAGASIDTVRSVMEKDVFAAQVAGCRILEASSGFGRCSMRVEQHHRNAMGNIMGGAIFTLADYALSIASNYGSEPTMSVSCSIEFISVSHGSELFASAELDKSGRSTVFGTVRVTDDTGKLIALMMATCHKLGARA